MLPGARLPTYLAAGFLRIPWQRFVFVTGIASFIWTFLVLGLSSSLGTHLIAWLAVYRQFG